MFRKSLLLLHMRNTKFYSSLHESVKAPTDISTDVNTRLLKVAIIGTPNAGKSTLINGLMDRRVCATSSKVHTTRSKSIAVYTEADAQIIFVDTPGLVNVNEHKKYKLERSCIKDSRTSLQQADLIGVIHDVSNEWTNHRIDIKVIRLLEEFRKKESFLIFNKVDVLKSKRKLLDLTRLCTENTFHGKPVMPIKSRQTDNNVESSSRGWPNFQEIFMISSLTGDGLPELKKYLTWKAKPGKWMFPAEVWSDQSAEELIVKNVKAKLLDYLPQEIPYQLKPELEYFDMDENGVITSIVLVQCPSERVAKLIAGDSDGRLRQINESVQHDLQDTFQNFVKIKIILTPVHKNI